MTRAVDSPVVLANIVQLATLTARQATYAAICDEPEIAQFRRTVAGELLHSWVLAGGEVVDLTAQVLQEVAVSIVRREVTKVVAGPLILHPDEDVTPPVWTFTASTPAANHAGALLCQFLASAQSAALEGAEQGWGRDKILDYLRALDTRETLDACAALVGANAAVLGPVP